MSTRSEEYQCRYCGFKTKTSARLSSHISQSPACLEKIVADNQPSTTLHKRHRSPTPGASDNLDDQPDNEFLYSSLLMGQPSTKRARVEDEEDPPFKMDNVFDDFKPPAGEPRQKLPNTSNDFERIQEGQQASGKEPWAPFSSVEDWDYARWIMNSGLSQREIDRMLSLDLLKSADPSFRNNRALLHKIDSLPTGPKWELVELSVEGEGADGDGVMVTEKVELWRRDPVECINELFSNPAFKDKIQYKPRKVYTNESKTEQVYGEMWTGQWWWKTQKSLPDGATIAAVIIGSDKTNLTRFSGDKVAWPVYITVGNIDKDTRRKPSENAVILLGYLPVSKLDKIKPSERSAVQHQIFHNCMKELLQPLIKAGTDGVEMLCSDGEVRLIFPILSAYLADHPEQCLVACCKENRCPKCLVPRLERGNPDFQPQLRDVKETLVILQDASLQMDDEDEFDKHGLRPVDPFWKNLPHCDIFSTFTPDLLHQLHKGVFGDHVSKWARKTVPRKDEIDQRYKSMTTHPSLRHFQKGITLVSQWTGQEYKELQKVFLSAIAGATDGEVVSAVRAVLDFIYYAHFEQHTDSTLKQLEIAWTDFHERKSIFIDHAIREHFNIPKLHSMQHYLHMIKSHGTTDNFNTELPERLHIDIAKDAFVHTNKRDYIAQMRLRLQRHEVVCKFTAYLQWAVKDYTPGGKKQHRTQDVDTMDPDADGRTLDDEDESPAIPNSQSTNTTSLQHHFAKNPPFTMSLDTINSKFGLHRFAETLEKFLRKSESLHPSIFHGVENAEYSIFKQFTVRIPSPPQVASEPSVRDVIRARAGEPGSTVLAKPDLLINDDTRIKWWDIKELCAAQVILIFKLPTEFGTHPTPLAYVRWFRAFSAKDQTVGMYKISPSTRNGGFANTSIIPITHIVRSCHLAPVFGKEIDRSWTHENVLKKASDFFLNPYLRHLDFFLLRYLNSDTTEDNTTS